MGDAPCHEGEAVDATFAHDREHPMSFRVFHSRYAIGEELGVVGEGVHDRPITRLAETKELVICESLVKQRRGYYKDVLTLPNHLYAALGEIKRE